MIKKVSRAEMPSNFNRLKAQQTLTQKVEKLCESFKILASQPTKPTDKLFYNSIVRLLEDFLESISSLSDTDLLKIISKIENNHGDDSNSDKDFNQSIRELLGSKQELLAKIREYFPINAAEFGFETNNDISPQTGDGINKTEINVFNLQESYLAGIENILNYFGYGVDRMESYTGNYDVNTIRVNPYTFIHLPRHKVILAESFVYGNALFLFDMEKLKQIQDLDLTPNSTFLQIAEKLNSLLKNEALDLAQGIKINHTAGFAGKTTAEIIKIVQSRGSINENEASEDQSRESNNSRLEALKLRQAMKTPEEWLAEFRKFYEENRGENGELQRQPSIKAEDKSEVTIAFKLYKIKSGGSYFEYKNELNQMGFDVEQSYKVKSKEQWLEEFKEFYIKNKNEENQLTRQPDNQSDDFKEAKLAEKLKKIRTVQHNFFYKDILKQMGFAVEPQRESISQEQWLEAFSLFHKQNSGEGNILLRQPSYKIPEEAALASKLSQLRGTRKNSFKYVNALKEMGFTITRNDD